MALKRLTVEEMIEISAPWATGGSAANAAIEKTPVLAALRPQVQEAYEAISALRAQQENTRLGELVEREARLSTDHDYRARGIYYALTGLAQVPGASAELVRLRYALFPEGLARTLTTCRGPAGHRNPIHLRLDADLQARLRAVNLHDRNLLDLTREWLGIAKQLGDVEQERARLGPAPTPGTRIGDARLAWIRITSIMLASAELAGVDEVTDQLLFGRLRAIEQNADARSRSQEARTPALTTTEPASPGKASTTVPTG